MDNYYTDSSNDRPYNLKKEAKSSEKKIKDKKEEKPEEKKIKDKKEGTI